MLSAAVLAVAGVYLEPAKSAEDASFGLEYGSRGWEWSNTNTGSYLWTGLRFQPRYSSRIENIHELQDFDEPQESGIRMNRARFKIGARYRKDIDLYQEYDLRNNRQLDLRATWITHPGFNFRIGQWKADYNRARVDSSGKQQFVERSIATYWFTVDRQWGAMASGRLNPGSRSDVSWWAGVLGGTGRSTASDGGRPMVLGRWQWNYSGEVLPFSQSALKRYQQPIGSLAFAAVANDSRFTRFSGAGGGQLPGYTDGEDNQYRIYQAMQEWAWQQGGVSFQQELHWKSIRDRKGGGQRNLYGGYVQGGWFPAERFSGFSPMVELALRAAYVNPDTVDNQQNLELTLGANWFFNNHRNKLTLDITYLTVENDAGDDSNLRLQIQWDLSI